jgi:hypothetical protein
VTVISSAECTGKATAVIKEFNCEPIQIQSSINKILCYGETGIIELSVNGGTEPYTYLWANGETTESIIATKTGTYIVSVIDGYGCKKEASYYHILTATDESPIGRVKIFPNPSLGIFYIRSEYNIIDSKVYDSTGKLKISKVNNNIFLDLSEESFGIYILHIFTEKGESQHKIIKTD